MWQFSFTEHAERHPNISKLIRISQPKRVTICFVVRKIISPKNNKWVHVLWIRCASVHLQPQCHMSAICERHSNNALLIVLKLIFTEFADFRFQHFELWMFFFFWYSDLHPVWKNSRYKTINCSFLLPLHGFCFITHKGFETDSSMISQGINTFHRISEDFDDLNKDTSMQRASPQKCVLPSNNYHIYRIMELTEETSWDSYS